MNKDPRFKIVSVCDKRQVKLDAVKERFKISDDNLFLDELYTPPHIDLSNEQKDEIKQTLIELGIEKDRP